ncbi:MAG: septation regulator SpoVG [Oscillospiraceae bacterium]|nr:septation regulator SpoVG [Oscillospiraceae bacterium]
MVITDLKIRKMMTEGRLRAIVSITLDQMLAVHDIKVVQGENRLFVAMPSRKDEGGIFRDIVHPISAQARKYLEEQILEAYEEQLALLQAESELEAVSAAEEPAEEAAPEAEAAAGEEPLV